MRGDAAQKRLRFQPQNRPEGLHFPDGLDAGFPLGFIDSNRRSFSANPLLNYYTQSVRDDNLGKIDNLPRGKLFWKPVTFLPIFYLFCVNLLLIHDLLTINASLK